MISFPSTLNTGGSNVSLPSATPRGVGELLGNMGKTFLNSAVNRVLGGVLSWVNGISNTRAGHPTYDESLERIPYDTYRSDEIVLKKPLAGRRPSGRLVTEYNKYWYENSLVPDPAIYSAMNTYRYTYDKEVIVPLGERDYDENGKIKEKGYGIGHWAGGTLSPSLFNPYYGIQKIGPTKNTPLVDTDLKENFENNSFSINTDFTDCSIKTLCKLSSDNDSELGQAKYKYSDFMYCKDLGMPNNRMITLRRFSLPVGDMIFGKAASADNGVYSIPGDVGRLVGYFDTEENKLEDILNYTFHATWEEREAERQQIESKEDDRVRPLGMVLNTMSNSYRQQYNESMASGNNLLDWALGGLFKDDGRQWYSPLASDPYNYDKNKVFDPIDTVRKTHLYTGVLEFQHEFTLTFDYTLRSYDNINPKAAMLDLIANATAVCYKRGNFWGGRQEIVGAQPNTAGWQKANNIIDQVWDKMGEQFSALRDGGWDVNAMLAKAGELFNAENMKKIAEKAPEQAVAILKSFAAQGKEVAGTMLTGMSGMAKGRLKNMLGRPQQYLFSSLLSGADVGLWHLTIGNPRNPIAVMGNLIVTEARIQQYGPLGQDDFPTGLRVIVSLKHARPRDMVDIQKMYTRGIMGIYQSMTAPAEGKGKEFVHTGEHLNTSSPNGIMYAGEVSLEKLKRNVNELS